MSTLTPPLSAPLPSAPSVVAPPGMIVINGDLRLPMLTTLEAFLDWSMSADCPERGRFAFLAGTFWADLMSEDIFTHGRLKAAMTAILWQIALTPDRGWFIPDGSDLVHRPVGLATIPDAMYVFYATVQSGRAFLHPNRAGGSAIRVEGTPDMVLDIVSETSVEKDTVTLPRLYHAAGVPEFWLVDAREELRFQILHRTDADYQPTQQPDGWWRSEVFGRDFLLGRDTDPIGYPRFVLEVR